MRPLVWQIHTTGVRREIQGCISLVISVLIFLSNYFPCWVTRLQRKRCYQQWHWQLYELPCIFWTTWVLQGTHLYGLSAKRWQQFLFETVAATDLFTANVEFNWWGYSCSRITELLARLVLENCFCCQLFCLSDLASYMLSACSSRSDAVPQCWG